MKGAARLGNEIEDDAQHFRVVKHGGAGLAGGGLRSGGGFYCQRQTQARTDRGDLGDEFEFAVGNLAVGSTLLRPRPQAQQSHGEGFGFHRTHLGR